MKDEGVTSVYILDDAEVYGKGVAKNTQASAEELGHQDRGHRLLGRQGVELPRAGRQDQGDRRRRRLHRRHHRQQRAAALQGPARGDAGRQAVRPRRRRDRGLHQGDPGRGPGADVLTAPTLSPDELPPAGQQFYKDYEAEYGEPQDEIDPYAVYGYEAMAVVCDAIAQGGDDRQAVIDAFFATKGRESPLGTYDIDPDGDTTLSDYGGYTAEGGKLVFNKVIKAQAQ